ncbi:MAG: hypothetical protein AAFQ81_01400, partial [Pseudomonadota bacterium]
MLGQMQDWPLRAHRVLDHAARYHARRPVISRLPESGAIARTDWGTIHDDAGPADLKAALRLPVAR